MRVLVTGGTGVLGRETIPRIAAAGHAVHMLSRRPPPAEGGEVAWVQADLTTGEGVAEAVAGVDAVVHLASDPARSEAVDVGGTQHLTGAAREAGISHLVYISIVGVDRIPFGYYQRKYAAEQLIAQSGVPYSVLRATQFHPFLDALLSAAARAPYLLPIPAGFKVQSVSEAEVAARLARSLEDGPRERLPDFGGPEVMTVGDAAERWARARGVRRRVVRVPIPGALAASFRAGHNTAPDGDRGSVRWEDWLAEGVSGAYRLGSR